jgi:hypothetical protein
VLLPFACGLQPSRHRAMSVAFGYYLGALAVFVASGFHVRDGIDPWASLAETLLVAGFAAIAWGMTAGEQKSDPLRFLTLMCAWFLTLATPLGAWGYAHPAMGWIFFGKGGMGIPTLLIAGLLTSFLITGIWWERRHGFALTATSARTLSFALCTAVILGGTYDQTQTAGHVGPVAVLSTKWEWDHVDHAASSEAHIRRLEGALRGLASVNREHAPIRLLVTDSSALHAKTPSERNVIMQRLRDAVQRYGVGLVLDMNESAPKVVSRARHHCVALLLSDTWTGIRFHGPSCRTEVVPHYCSSTPGTCSEKTHGTTKMAVRLERSSAQPVYPALLMLSAIGLSKKLPQIQILRASRNTFLLALRRRAEVKHLNAFAWSKGVGFLATTSDPR